MAAEPLSRRELSIEAGIPLPNRASSRTTFAAMEVGDSILDTEPTPLGDSRIRSAASMWARRNAPHIKFSSRKVPGGIRVWRVA